MRRCVGDLPIERATEFEPTVNMATLNLAARTVQGLKSIALGAFPTVRPPARGTPFTVCGKPTA